MSPKVIIRKVGSFANALGFGVDVGLQYRIKGFQVGFMGRDLTSTFTAWKFKFTDEQKQVLFNTGNELPLNTLEIATPQLWLGFSYEYKFKKIFKIQPEVDLNFTTDGMRNVLVKSDKLSMDLNAGLEVSFVDIVFLRTGFGNIQKSTDDAGKKITTFQPNIGAGLGYKGVVRIDYAYTDIGDQSDALFSHVISLHLGFNLKGKKTTIPN